MLRPSSTIQPQFTTKLSLPQFYNVPIIPCTSKSSPFHQKLLCFQMFYNNQMKFKERDASSKRKYSKISICKRKKLIDSVIGLGESLIKTTKKLNINLSTARLIIKLFKSTGSFYMKNFKHPPKEDLNSQFPRQNMEIGQDNEEDGIQNQDVQESRKEESSNKEEGTEDGVGVSGQYYWYYLPYYFVM